MGLMCCSPSREGLRVWFDPVRIGPPDEALDAG
jgi:regulation of enolase protein 1 (concanavalin A-like superfamily)